MDCAKELRFPTESFPGQPAVQRSAGTARRTERKPKPKAKRKARGQDGGRAFRRQRRGRIAPPPSPRLKPPWRNEGGLPSGATNPTKGREKESLQAAERPGLLRKRSIPNPSASASSRSFFGRDGCPYE